MSFALGAPASTSHEHPRAVELCSLQREFQPSLFESFARISYRFPHAPIPEHDGPTAILAVWNDAFEAAVFQRVIFDLHRETLHGRIEVGSFGDRPTLEHAIEFQTEVVVKVGGIVLLDDETQFAAPSRYTFATRFGRRVKVAFSLIFAKVHGRSVWPAPACRRCRALTPPQPRFRQRSGCPCERYKWFGFIDRPAHAPL